MHNKARLVLLIIICFEFLDSINRASYNICNLFLVLRSRFSEWGIYCSWISLDPTFKWSINFSYLNLPSLLFVKIIVAYDLLIHLMLLYLILYDYLFVLINCFKLMLLFLTNFSI